MKKSMVLVSVLVAALGSGASLAKVRAWDKAWLRVAVWAQAAGV